MADSRHHYNKRAYKLHRHLTKNPDDQQALSAAKVTLDEYDKRRKMSKNV